MNLLCWYENKPLPEAVEAEKRLYPEGIHGALAQLFRQEPDCCVRTAVMQDPDFGLSDELLNWADVVVYFSQSTGGRFPTSGWTRFSAGCWRAWGLCCSILPTQAKSFPG